MLLSCVCVWDTMTNYVYELGAGRKIGKYGKVINLKLEI